MPTLSAASYGKSNIRLAKVIRPDPTNPKHQLITECTIATNLSGAALAPSWTTADNSHIVATDTQKQTAYILAKQHPVHPPERFAATLAQHFLDEYAWLNRAEAHVTVHRWTRMDVDGAPHAHSFLRDGEEKRIAEVVAERGRGLSVRGGIEGLLLLKTTGSQFWGFHRDDFTRLGETWDRILSTEVQASWWVGGFEGEGALAEVGKFEEGGMGFDGVWERVRRIVLETFAKEDSPSVQNTMYKMGELVLVQAGRVGKVEFSLPNKHYFEIGELDELRWLVAVWIFR